MARFSPVVFYLSSLDLFGDNSFASLVSSPAVVVSFQALRLKPNYPKVLLRKARLNKRLSQWDLAIKVGVFALLRPRRRVWRRSLRHVKNRGERLARKDGEREGRQRGSMRPCVL